MAILYLKTGRTRTLTLTKTVHFNFELGIDSQLVPAGSSGSSSLTAYPKLGDSSFQFYAAIGVSGPKGPVPGIAQYTLFAETQIPGGTLQTSTYPVGSTPSDPIVYGSGAVNGTMSLTMQVEEWCEIALFTDLYSTPPLPYILDDGRAFPDYSSIYPGYCNAGYPDGLAAQSLRFYEQVVNGSQITVTANNGGASSTQSYTVTAPFTVDYLINDEDAYGSTTRVHSTNPMTYIYSSTSGTLSSSTTWGGVSFDGMSSYSNSGYGGTVSASDVGGHTISTSASIGSYFATSANGTISESWTPPLQYDLNLDSVGPDGTGQGHIYDWSTGAGRTPPVTQISATGQVSSTSTLRRQGGTISETFFYEAIGGANESTPYTYSVPTLAEWQPQRLFIDSASLAATGDDPRDWRCQFLGKSFESFTIQQQPSVQVLASQSLTSATGALTPLVLNWEGYRYLAFQADQSASLSLSTPQGLTKSWSWTVATPGTPQTITLDLCSPSSWNQDSNQLPGVDERGSRYPLDSTGSFPDEVHEGSSLDGNGILHDAKGAYWGVFQVSTLNFGGLGTGVTLNLGEISLLRKTSSSISFSPKFADYETYQVGGNVLVQPFCCLASDHKGFYDSYAATHTPGVAWQDQTLAGLIADLNNCPGWVCTAASSFPDSQWHNNSGPAAWAWGSGHYWDGSQWHNGLDVSVGAALVTVFAQPLYDEVSAYPGAGKGIWDGSAYDSMNPQIPLNAAKTVRGRAQRRVFEKGSGLPYPSASIQTMLHGTMTGCGSAQAGADGYYATGAGFGPGDQSIDTELVGSQPAAIQTQVWQNRELATISFVAPAQSDSPSLLESESGGYLQIYLNSGVLVIQGSSLPVPPAQVSTSHGELGPLLGASICLDADGCLWVATTSQSYQSQLFQSFDSGKTLSDWPSISMSSQQCGIRCGPDGTLALLWLSSLSGNSGPSNFMARLKHLGDSDFTAAKMMNDQTGAALLCDGSGFGFDCAREGAARWVLTFVVNGESSPSVWVSSDECATWIRTT